MSALKEVKQIKTVNRDVTSSNSVAMTDEIFASLNKANKLIACLVETYTDKTVMCGVYEGRYYIDSSTVDMIGAVLL